ncbi:hypothetical protein [Vibrio owensii]|uniref:hypothetical protein n=1 Tax=Vibrio harveyi group TaxID=717610 RepID=UPI003CC5EFE2
MTATIIRMDHLVSNPEIWIPTEMALPALAHDEDEGYYSQNVITKDNDGYVTISRINHAPENWFSIVDETEIEKEVKFWCVLDCEGESLGEKYDILHDKYGFMLDQVEQSPTPEFNPRQDYKVVQCISELGMLDKVAFYHELISLAWVKHLELNA